MINQLFQLYFISVTINNWCLHQNPFRSALSVPLLYEPVCGFTPHVYFTDSINPVVLVFVSGSVNSSSNSSASKGLVLSGTFSDFTPNCFKVKPAVQWFTTEKQLNLFFQLFIIILLPVAEAEECWEAVCCQDTVARLILMCSGSDLHQMDALMNQAMVPM